MEIGQESAKAYAEAIAGSKTVVWDSSLGVFEWPQFEAATTNVHPELSAWLSSG